MTNLKNIPTSPPKEFTKEFCEQQLAGFHKKLFELQNLFYADGRFALLVILQGVDTAGKDGTIRHVMTAMNPMGVNVKSFKKPTEEELSHDFFWRIYPHFPAKGMIEVFNRSYYEDIIVPSIENNLSKEILRQRCDLINLLERHLETSNTHILKFFLHISQDEQKGRIQERMTQPNKRWKYSKEDAAVAERWEDYMEVYDKIIDQSNDNKWHIIPADKRWYRNYAVAKVLTEQLESLHLEYPGQPES